MRVQHNIPAMSSYRNYANNNSAINKNLEKLSSGYKINRAGDDAAGLAISEKMRAQITGLDVAKKNAKDGISLVQTAEGALTEVHSMLNRMVELAEQSANGTYSNEVDREQLQKEVDSLRSEINRVADSANFNGMKLLDGSLSASGTATKVEINGINSSVTAATKGQYKNSVAVAAQSSLTEGDVLTFNVGLSDGKSYSAKFTVSKDSAAQVKVLKAADGTEYALATAGTATQGEFTSAIEAELKKTELGSLYTISGATGVFTFDAKEAGTETPRVLSMDGNKLSNGTATPFTAMNVTETAAKDAYRTFTSLDVTTYDGYNYDDALFTINGHKFLILEEKAAAGAKNGYGGSSGSGNDPFNKIGNDVTFLWAKSGSTGVDTTDDYAVNNARKIAEVTGLNVTVDANGTNISLKSVTGGLTLQIGDTSDKFNQMTVSVGDIHTKALGLDGIDISIQTGAQDALDQIKTAINTVSDIRGGLGALQNRLEHTINNLSVMKENIQDAESTIRDTDVAEEMMKYTKNSILVQSAQAMLAQANQQPQGVLQLLQ
jgi:flagellin